MRKDSLREFIAIAIEAYDLASTVPPLEVYRETVDECEPLDAPTMRISGRRAMLNFSIDVKGIYDFFILNLERRYGKDRAERVITWVKVGYIEQFHTEHRVQIKDDIRVLRNVINKYKRGSAILNTSDWRVFKVGAENKLVRRQPKAASQYS